MKKQINGCILLILIVIASSVIISFLFVAILFLTKKEDYTKIKSTSGYDKCVLTKELECNNKGHKCRTLYTHVYDKNGRKTTYYTPFSSWLHDFEVGKSYPEVHFYDEKGNREKDLLYCNNSFKNCSRLSEYKYDKNNNLIKEYINCKKDLSDCRKIVTYNYDSHNHKISEHFEGMAAGIYEGRANKYIYDESGKNTIIYDDCDNDFSSCKFAKINKYDENNNIIETRLCDSGLSNCKYKNQYAYDKYNNLIDEYKYCKIEQDNCPGTASYRYVYDEKGRKIEYQNYYGIIKYVYSCE